MSFPANDLEKSDPHADDLAVVSFPSTGCADKPDIEHSLVSDDPRQWSRGCKVRRNCCNVRITVELGYFLFQTLILVVISAAALVAGLAGNIYNRTLIFFLH